MELCLVLPFPPSVNGLYANAGRVGRVKTRQYHEWIAEAAHAAKQQPALAGINPHKPYFTHKVQVHYQYKRPDNRVRDVFNYEKALTDFMVEWGIFKDDALIERGMVEWVYGEQYEGVTVCIRTLDG